MGFFDSWKVKINTNLRHSVLYPGNVLEGVVELRVDGYIDFTAVRIKVTGKERVHIRRERSGPNPDDPPVVENYRESCVVYKQLVTLAGAMKTMPGGFSGQMPPGVYYYPFAIQLPTNIPPSFSKRVTDDYAEILYYLKAYVDIPMGRDAVHRAHFTVVRPMPISQHAEMAPVNVDKVFDVTCCCCIDKGKVHAILHMDRTLIAIDRDNLTVCCDIDNSRGQEPVKSLEISLINNLTYKADYVTEKNRVVAGKHFLEREIPPGQKARIAGVIPLPRNIVPSLTTFNLQSDYKITIEMNIPWASDPMQEFNVILAQSVDETNYSPRVFWQENKYVRLGKGQFTGPEMYYQPPPQPVYQCVPIPLAPPPNVNMYSYNITVPPLGLPSVMWEQQNMPMVQGQAAVVQPLGIQWQAGYTQTQCANTVPPTVEPIRFDMNVQFRGDGTEPLLS
jgi:hypothetical protein